MDLKTLARQAHAGMHPALWDAMKDKGSPGWQTNGCTATQADAENWIGLLSVQDIRNGISHEALVLPSSLGAWKSLPAEQLVLWPKNADLPYSKADLVNLCKGDESIAYELYECCEWACPETVIDEDSREPIDDQCFRICHAITVEDMRKQVVAWFNQMNQLVRSNLKLPPNHDFRENDDNLKWFLNCPILSTEGGMSVFIGKNFPDDASADARASDPDQIHVEIRIQWPERDVVFQNGIGPQKCLRRFHEYSGPQFRAHIFAEQGARYWGKHTSMLASKEETFMYGDSIEDVVMQAVKVLKNALAPYIPSENTSSFRGEDEADIQSIIDDITDRADKYGFTPTEDTAHELVNESAALLSVPLSDEARKRAVEMLLEDARPQHLDAISPA